MLQNRFLLASCGFVGQNQDMTVAMFRVLSDVQWRVMVLAIATYIALC